MLGFSDNLKIYVFKEKQTVSFSIKVSDNFVNTFELDINDFEKILDKWKSPGGFDEMLKNHWWTLCYKKTTPRPECSPASYVRISVSVNNQQFNYRVDYSDMIRLEKDYFYQKNNKMYWDKDV
jgi:hypothetical protein